MVLVIERRDLMRSSNDQRRKNKEVSPKAGEPPKDTLKERNLSVAINLAMMRKEAPHRHCAKSVRFRSYSGPHFPAFGLNVGRYSVFTPNAGKCRPE